MSKERGEKKNQLAPSGSVKALNSHLLRENG